MSKLKPLGYYNYTVILTYIGMLLGIAGIYLSIAGIYATAVLCLMAAGFCDMFDGAIASTRVRTPQEKCFGIQIDSLSDLVCFGVLPSVLTFSLNRSSRLALVVCPLYTLCALIRLAYFNVDEMERQETENTSRTIYYGLPVTVSALWIPMLYVIALYVEPVRDAIAFLACLIVMGVMFLTPFRLKKPKAVGKVLLSLLGLATFVPLVLYCVAR